MSAERRISILIDTAGNPAGIDLIESKFGDLEMSADRLFASLRAGMAIDIGGKLVAGLASVPAAFERAVQRGVEFNATLQTAELGIAAILKQFDDVGRFKTFDDAMAASASAIELLKQKAKESPATFQELVGAFQGTAGAMAAANIPLQDQVNLIVNMSQALSGLGIHSSQILQETRALITGNINANAAAAKILGITAADITAAKAQGELYQFLTGKISAFAEAGSRGATTMNAALSNLEDTIDDVLATVTKPIFEGMTKGTLDLSKAISDPKIQESLRTLGIHIAEMVKAGYDLTEWAVKNADVLIFLTKAAAAFGATIAAIHLAQLVVDIGKKTVAIVASTVATKAETAALASNTAAQLANNAARKAGSLTHLYAPTGPAAGRAAEAAAMAERARLANQGRFAGSVLPRAPAAAPAAGGMLSYTGVGATGAAAIAAPIAILVTAAMGAWFIRQEKAARLQAQTMRLQEQSERYGGDTRGSTRSMSQMATVYDRIATEEMLRKQLSAAREDRSQAIMDAEEDRLRIAESQIKLIEHQLANIDRVYERVAAVNRAEQIRTEELEKHKRLLADMDRRAGLAAAEVPDLTKQLRQLDMSPDAARLEDAKRELGNLAGADAIAQAERALRANTAPGSTERQAGEAAILKQKIQIAQLNKEIAALEKRIADEAKRGADETERAAETKRNQAAAREDITSDILIAEARVRGEDELAERLERQKRLRSEIKRIVDATGASEEDAERVARRLILAQEAAAKKAAGKDGDTGRPVAPRGNRPETYDEANRRLGGGESYDEINRRMSGGRWTPPAVQTVPSFSSVVPAPAPAPTPAPQQPVGGRTSKLEGTAMALEQLKDDVEGAMDGEAEAKALEALGSLGETIVARFAAGDRRYAQLEERYREMESQLKTGRTR